MKTLTLTEEEAYILGCVMGYVRYANNTTSLLNKIAELEDDELGVDDFNNVVFNFVIESNKTPEITIDFKGE